MPENTKRIADLMLELWNTGKPEAARQLYSDNAERRDPFLPESLRGPQQIAEYVAEVRSAFPDFNLEIKQMIAEGDQLATEWTCTGTQKGEFQGIPPSGRRIEVTGIGLNRIQDGRLVDERAYFDRLGILEQLGVASGAGQAGAQRGAAATP